LSVDFYHVSSGLVLVLRLDIQVGSCVGHELGKVRELSSFIYEELKFELVARIAPEEVDHADPPWLIDPHLFLLLVVSLEAVRVVRYHDFKLG
jgi:hypothetical protein